MDGLTIGLLGAAAVIIGIAFLALMATHAAIGRAQSAPRRRAAARAGSALWGALLLAVPASLLGALGILPAWSYGVGVAVILFCVLPGILFINSRLEPAS
ncbi:MAG: hypothetical protein OEU46_15355 [Alphaproteobacteria bacterium]|nr:hypothetical protein [Alphaproteobacteria bacterium]